MRAVIQRVSEASVSANDELVSSIKKGLLILLGVEAADGPYDVSYLVQKISNMRIFQDEQDKMNLSLQDVKGEVLIVSQFTLHASTKKGNRPSFIKAAPPDQAEQLYEAFKHSFQESISTKVQGGIFGAMMDVQLINDGPVTIIIDSKNKS